MRRKNQKVWVDPKGINAEKHDTEYKQEYHRQYREKYRKITKEIRITLEEEEYQELKSQAKADGKPMTRFVMGHFNASYNKKAVFVKEEREIIKQLLKIGNNINQITRNLNNSKLKILNKQTSENVKQMLNEIRAIREAVIANA